MSPPRNDLSGNGHVETALHGVAVTSSRLSSAQIQGWSEADLCSTKTVDQSGRSFEIYRENQSPNNLFTLEPFMNGELFMTTLLQLNASGTLCWAVLGDDSEVHYFPFFDEIQALSATIVPESKWDRVPTQRYFWKSVSGGPTGYHFFVRTDTEGNILGIVVWGPYGLLPGVYFNLEAASDAAWEDWWDHNPTLRPQAPGPRP